MRSFIQGAGVGLTLAGFIGINLAPHDPCIGQRQQAVDEHLAATIKALGEWQLPSFMLDQRLPGRNIEVGQQPLITRVVALARQQRGCQGISHGADANLQGTAIAYQRAGVQADEMVL
ncbi:hypothetical protein D3C84_873110 [compost metagenome]